MRRELLVNTPIRCKLFLNVNINFCAYRHEMSLRSISKPSKIEDTPLAKLVEQEGEIVNEFDPDMTFKPSNQVLPQNTDESLKIKPTEEDKVLFNNVQNPKGLEEVKHTIVQNKLERADIKEKIPESAKKVEPEAKENETTKPKKVEAKIAKNELGISKVETSEVVPEHSNTETKKFLQHPSKPTSSKQANPKPNSDKKLSDKISKVGAKLQNDDKLRQSDKEIVSRNGNQAQALRKTNSLQDKTLR